MKKRILALFLIATLVCLVFALVACAGGSRCTDHNWQPYKVVDGNIQTEICSNCGVTRRLCYPFPHTYDSFVDNGDGKHTAHCSKCGIDEAVEHTFNGTAPISIHESVKCDDCGAQFYKSPNHQLVDDNGDLTCDICGESLGCQHNYSCVVTEPTCLQDGYTTYTCTGCDDSYISDIVESCGHQSETIVLTEATCSSAGVVMHRCTESGCGYSYMESTGFDLENGHIWTHDDEVFKVEDICNGAKVDAKCILCKVERILTIESDIEHEWVLETGSEGYDPGGCYWEGLDTFYCEKCWSWNDVSTPAKGHNYVKTPMISDCLKDDHNYYAMICSICDMWDESYEEYIPAQPHTDEDNNHFCDVCGLSTCEYCDDMNADHKCDVCQKQVTDRCYDNNGDYMCDTCGFIICNHFGYEWDNICDGCGTNFCGHSWVYHEAEFSNCNDGGYLSFYCGDCYTLVSREYIAPGSSHCKEYCCYDRIEATCTEDGLEQMHFYCIYCYNEDIYEEEVIPATGHSYVAISTTNATCFSAGSVTYLCVYCDDTYTVETEALEHTPVTITKEATCNENGSIYEECSACGMNLGVVQILPKYDEHINEDNDGKCDRCGASFCVHHETELAFNADKHYQQCVLCDARIVGTFEEHIDSNEDGNCDVCDSCIHSFTVFEYDPVNHWSKCDNCDYICYFEHDHIEIGTTEANCGNFGSINYACTECGHTFRTETQAPTGEHLNVEVYFNAEKHWSICTDCGIVFNESRHEMYYEDESYNGCFAAHAYLWACDDSDCGYSYYDESDAYGCTEDYYWDEVCWDCGKCNSHYLGEEYDANNDGVCDICGYCIDGHTFSTEPIEVKTPTCDSRYGYSKYKCENCKYVLKKDYTGYLDTIINNKIEAGETDWSICRFDWHNYEVKEVVAPNCGYNGYTIYVCVDCGWEIEGNYTATVGEHINEDENIWYCDSCGICLCENHVDEDDDYRCDICDSSTCEWHDTYYKSNHDYHWEYCMQCNRVVSDLMPHEESYDDESGERSCSYCDHNYCESFLDVDGDNLCDRMGCGYSNCIAHIDENNDYHCDQCSKSMCPEHVSDGNYYHYFYHFSHAQFCVVCGELFYDEECYDWDYDNYCDFCGDSTCGHYDSSDDFGQKNGYCDYCYVDMSTIEPDCLHEDFSADGNSGRYHYGFCEDCGKYIYAHHNYTEVLDKEVPIEGETCYKDRYYTYTCSCCGYVEKEVRVYGDHKDEDEDYICDVCNNYC